MRFFAKQNTSFGGLIMQTLKKFFPLSFKFVKDGGNLAIGIIIYVAIGIIVPVVLGAIMAVANGIAALLPILLIITLPLSIIVGVIDGVISLYCLAGIVFLILVYTKVFTDPDAPIEVQATEENSTDAK